LDVTAVRTKIGSAEGTDAEREEAPAAKKPLEKRSPSSFLFGTLSSQVQAGLGSFLTKGLFCTCT
jgi:hypothetical protein